MRKTVLHIILLLSVITVNAQNFYPVDVLNVKTGYILADNFGSLYFLEGGILKKYEPATQTLYTFYKPSLGEPTSFDVSDPLRIVVYFSSYNIICFLDKSLVEITDPVDLSNLNITSPLAVCGSKKGGFWLFDGFDGRIKRFNHEGDIEIESSTIESLYQKKETDMYLKEQGNRVYLYYPNGTFIFDVFGGYKTFIPLPNLKHFIIKSGNLLYFNGENYIQYNLDNYSQQVLPIPDIEGIKDCIIINNHIYILTDEKIKIFKLNS